MWTRIQRNYLPILSAVIFVIIVVLVVVQIDKQVYQDRKKEICMDNWEQIRLGKPYTDEEEAAVKQAKQRFDRLENQAGLYFRTVERLRNLAGSRAVLTRQAESTGDGLEKIVGDILQADNSLILISVSTVKWEDGDRVTEEVIRQSADKYAEKNNFSNSLILQNFWGETLLTFEGADGERIGEITFRYTTPQGFPEIRQLTARYRYLLLGVVLALGLLYWYILRHLILPIHKISKRIDKSKGELPEILPHPRTVLESAYNDLARDALLNVVTRTMAEYMSVDRLVSTDEIVGNMPGRIAPNFGFAAVYAVELIVGETAEEPIKWSRSAFHPDTDESSLPKPTEKDWLEVGRRFDLDWDQAIFDFRLTSNGRRPWWVAPVAFETEERRVTFLAATPRVAGSQENVRWHRETLFLVANAIRTGLETIEIQRNLIMREQSKANISLSRNLGHDLTNVVATSKLELDTVRRFLKLPTEKQMEMSPQVKTIFTESLAGLLNNTKFLQEIINIYRSFSYMHHPEYEWINFNDLVDEVVELFQLSLSRRFEIHKDYDEHVEPSYVEPRLMKLAVFNLLSNATDALKRRAMGEGDFGAALWVSTRSQPGEFGMSLAVRDNGLGIRNRQGELADAEEIRDIFQTGFTTKKEGLAEGLGLNWVKQIIHEFHRGQLSARNHPEGGAEVTMLMPRFDTPPGQQGYGDDETTGEPAPDKQTPQEAEVKN